ncbi:MAG: tRNA (adenosine(37)-N6)-dimethylallyltransferase MiaA [Planctomycetaceae bacterium]|nr:tRNA (adenosine(37)-N6)-dimethylallyltransferase MiaA [Planctomycetaceae bacterium]
MGIPRVADDSRAAVRYRRGVNREPTDTPESPIVLLLGPTGGGKTDVAVSLARAIPGGGECVIADSMQVYADLVIGTAQPTLDEQAGVPHHLCGVIDPAGDAFTLRDWLDRAEAEVRNIHGRDRVPILVGGTNLYARGFLEGVFEGPGRDDVIRAEFETLDEASLHRRLQEVDSASAERIHPNDRRRMIRALEVEAITGRPLSEHQAEWGASIGGRPSVRVVVLDWPTERLNQRINARVRAMMAAGFLEEVRRLEEAGRLGPQAIEAVGYRELREHLRGRLGLEQAVERIKIRTRRYGKQQRTWLRRFLAVPGAIRIDPVDRTTEEIVQELVLKLETAT